MSNSRKTIHLLLFKLLFACSVNAQVKNNDTTVNLINKTVVNTGKIMLPVNFSSFTSTHLPPAIPADFSYTHLAFFCKKELQLEKVTKIAFRFRLGSMEACNKLEGKH